jgi:CBS domain-containing protein
MSQWVDVINASTTSREAARRMRDQNIGSLPVGEENGQLIGMVTDRDIVVGAVAEDVLPSNTAVRGSALPSTTLSSSKQ